MPRQACLDQHRGVDLLDDCRAGDLGAGDQRRPVIDGGNNRPVGGQNPPVGLARRTGFDPLGSRPASGRSTGLNCTVRRLTIRAGASVL